MPQTLKEPLKIKNTVKRLSAADYITLVRIVCTAVLCFLEPLSAEYFVLYSLAGVSDIVDGTVARATKTTSEFGAKLDSVADLLFYTVTLLKILPILISILPKLIWYGVALAILLRLSAYITVAVKYRRFASQHTYMNKLTGLMLFVLPYVLQTSIGIVYSIATCAVGIIGSLEEFIMHLIQKEYNTNKKTVIG